jgi:sodium/hydrogen exchanger 8
MNRYTTPNLSEFVKQIVGQAYSYVAHAAETLLFLFLGFAVFSFEPDYEDMGAGLFFVMFFMVLLGRFLNIGINTVFLNLFRTHRIPWSFAFVMWFTGLRGAIAFALSIDSMSHLSNGNILLALTILYAIISIIIFGGATAPILKFLGLVDEPMPQANIEN